MNRFKDSETGQSMVEFAIVFPILLLLILIFLQTSLLFTAKLMVKYSAFCAARSACVKYPSPDEDDYGFKKMEAIESANRAAVIGCAPISPKLKVPEFQGISLANIGWAGKLLEGSTKLITSQVLTRTTLNANNGDVTAEVTYWYSMRIPIANKMFFYIVSFGKIMKEIGYDEIVSDIILFLMELKYKDESNVWNPYAGYPDPNFFGIPLYLIPIKATSTLSLIN